MPVRILILSLVVVLVGCETLKGGTNAELAKQAAVAECQAQSATEMSETNLKLALCEARAQPQLAPVNPPVLEQRVDRFVTPGVPVQPQVHMVPQVQRQMYVPDAGATSLTPGDWERLQRYIDRSMGGVKQ